jgi:hypothetical protein
MLFQFDGRVVGIVGPWPGFGSVPEAMPAIDAPLGTPRLAHHIVVFLELILLAHESEPDDPWADVRRHDKVNEAI